MEDSSLYLFPLIFGFSILTALFIYWIGGRISRRSSFKNHNDDKTAPYACGEDLPAEEFKVDLERFFIFAVYFMIFDVLAFVLATSFYSSSFISTAYSLIALMAVAMLIFSGRRK